MLQDERVRSLLREAVAEESFDGDSVEAVARSAQRRQRQSAGARIAIGVVTVSLLALSAVRVVDKHNDGGGLATSAGVLRLAPSAMPGGLVLRAKTDTSAVRPPTGQSFTAIYRDGADRRVIVNGRASDGPDSATTAPPRLGAELEGGFYIVARPATGVTVTVGTRGLDRDESLALAQTLRNVAALAPAAYQLDPLPKGFVLLALADDHDLLFLDGTRSVYAPPGSKLSDAGPRIDIEVGRENPAAIEIDRVYAAHRTSGDHTRTCRDRREPTG